MPKVYIVEDDENIREAVLYALNLAGFETQGFETGADFFARAETDTPDLAILDIMLPGEDGLSVLKRLRSDSRTKSLPIIMLTAKSSEFDKVKGLDMGADDYIAKPFGVMELISRVKAILRRSVSVPPPDGQFVLGVLKIDNECREVTVSGNKVNLTFKEYELLGYLALNSGLALSRDKIMEAVWGYSFECESRTLDMHIRSLRQKLKEAGVYIQTIRNVGYSLKEN
ncbi:MAG: response regulator transcription factor [Oscillospiraceae bacterium]|nr:response regulator transcription factor [Oscillospiraceae bacterium]